MFIYHIVLPEPWERLKDRPSYQPESLDTEGFIHCSYLNQLDGVLKRYYHSSGKVIILKIDTEKLLPKLVEEPSTENEIYPHVHGRINRSAIIGTEERVLNTSFETAS